MDVPISGILSGIEYSEVTHRRLNSSLAENHLTEKLIGMGCRHPYVNIHRMEPNGMNPQELGCFGSTSVPNSMEPRTESVEPCILEPLETSMEPPKQHAAG